MLNPLAALNKLLSSAASLYAAEKNIGKRSRKVLTLDQFIADSVLHAQGACSGAGAKSLDLGCGSKPQNPFDAEQVFGVDIREDVDANVRRGNLFLRPIPFSDNEFDFCTAINFIEHVPRVIVVDGEILNPFIQLMNDVYRILRGNGLFLSVTPAFPSKEAFQDPTHVNIITEDTFRLYFCSESSEKPWASIYGYDGSFRLINQAWLHNSFLVTLMQVVK